MKILILGDSFAAEWPELGDANSSWTTLLGRDHQTVNLAQAGCSEYRILQQLKSQTDLDQFDCIIVCHTAPDRIYTRRHPVHVDGLYRHADLIFADIDYHASTTKNPAVISARDFFVYHYDECYQLDIYRLVVREIDRLLAGRFTIIIDNFNTLNGQQYPHYLKFSNLTQILPGEINHCPPSGHIKIYHAILDIVQVPESVLPDFQIRPLRSLSFTSLDCQFGEASKPQNLHYPYPVHYRFNRRGFRDSEWPSADHLATAIWCFGDSGTMGLETVFEHTWPYILESRTQTRTIKISARAASNDWIFRRAHKVLLEIQPKIMVINWTFLTRREDSIESVREKKWQIHYQAIRDPSWPECAWQDLWTLPDYIREEINTGHVPFDPVVDDIDRCIHCDPMLLTDDREQVNHTINLIKTLEQSKQHTKIIHSVVPGFANQSAMTLFYEQMSNMQAVFIPEFAVLDRAADNQHYGVKTSHLFVDEIISRLWSGSSLEG